MVSILVLDFYLFSIPEWKAATLAQLYYKICLAFITGFIFYFINVHLQNERAKVKMYLYIHNKIADLISTNQDLIAMIIKSSRQEVTNYKPEEEELKEYCLRVNPNDSCNMPRLPGFFENWFIAIDYIYRINKGVIDDLINIRDNISIDVLEILSKIEDTLDNRVNFTRGLPMGNQDLEVLHSGIYQYTKYVYKLQEKFNEKYKQHRWEYHELTRLANSKK